MLVEISFGPVSPSPLRFLAYQIGFGGDGVGVGGARAVMTGTYNVRGQVLMTKWQRGLTEAGVNTVLTDWEAGFRHVKYD